MMNDKLKELAEQIDIIKRPNMFGFGWDYTISEHQLKTFAESIIKECASICDRLEDEYLMISEDDPEPDTIQMGIGAGICCTEILEHFGTEL